MNHRRQYLGKWELGCMVFNSCIYKIFTTYPRNFTQISGSAGWVTAIFTGILFLAILSLALILYRPHENKGLPELLKQRGGNAIEFVVYAVYLAYWIFSAVYALSEFSNVLTTVSYVRSPKFYIMFFFLLGAIIPVICGMRAVYRLHSLSVLFVGAVSVAIAVFGLRYAHLHYLTPILGTGPSNVFITGLSTLFMYSDIIFIFLLSPLCRPEINFSKTVLTSAGLAVFVNVFLMIVFSMSQSTDTHNIVNIPIYPLTKSAYFGRFWSRMDAAYLSALIVSGILYLTLAIHLIVICFKGLRLRKKTKVPKVTALLVILCLILTGCYDNREVEQSAYLIALGIDKGENTPFKYTFQLSNPLETGNTTSGKDESAEPMKGSEEPENKGVNNTVIEAESFYSALNILKSGLSKEPELSHLKIIVFSKELATEGLLEHSSLLFREREIRPGANLCLADSAEDFLTKVKPTLELSTARYYELLFRNKNAPYAPVTELWDFVSKSISTSEDCVLPVVDGDALSGMGVFHNGKMVAEADPEKAMLYNLLSGNAEQIAIHAGNSLFSVTCKEKADIKTDRTNFPPSVTVSVKINTDLIYGNKKDVNILENYLAAAMNGFLAECSALSADILGIGNTLRSRHLTNTDWESLNMEEFIKNASFTAQIKVISGN